MTELIQRMGMLGFGAAQLGNLNTEIDDASAKTAVDAAWAAGLRYFDTAPHYGLGLSERRLGAALQGRRRNDFVVSTKAGRILEPNPDYRPGLLDDAGFAVPAELRRRWDFSRDGILRSVETSLNRMGLDRLDIVYLHDPDEHWDEAVSTGVDTLIELRDQGVVEAIGAGMNQSQMLTRFVNECDIDIVMLAGRFTLLDQRALDDLLPAAFERGVNVVAAGAYNSGILSSEHVSDTAVYDYGPAGSALIDRARRIAQVAAEYNVTLPEAAVRYPLTHPAISTVVLGMRSPDHVHAAINRAATNVPPELWQELANRSLLDPRSTNERPTQSFGN